MQRLATVLAGACLATVASAQLSIVIPNGYAAVEGSTSNAFPWGRGGTGLLHQCVYDSSHFTLQGITYPILIQGLRWRPNTGVALVATNYPTPCSVRMSTCPVDWTATTTTFATNRGADETLCFQGPVTFGPQAAQTGPTPFGINIPLTTPFLYDPNNGDLNIECDLPIQTGYVGTTPQLDVHGVAGQANAARIYWSTGYTGYPGGVASGRDANHAVVVQVDYVPASGLYPGFTATPRTGPIGQIVQFTDHSYSSAPGGILAWQWDLDGDSIIDSTAQNPVFQYNTGGNYNVTLTVIDGTFGVQTLTQNAYIGINLAHASFTTSVTGTTVQFTDTSTGNPTSWAWDFENDGIVDSTAQNPSHTYPAPGAYNCKLTVNNAYSTDFTVVNLGLGIIPIPPFASTFSSATATRGFWFQAPTRFSVVSMSVPDETANGLQNVALYRLAAAPPVFSASATGGLEFYATGQPSNAAVPCAVSFDTGEFVGVLGACGTTTMLNSYGNPAGPYASSVLGVPTTLTRFLTQFNLVTSGGTAAYSQEPTGQVSRVTLGVSAAVGLQYGTGTPSPYAPAPTLKTTSLPIIGQNAVMTFTNNDTAVIGIIAAGFGRASIPTPLGTLLLNGIAVTDVINGAAVLGPGSYTYSFAIPPNPALQGFGPLNWQAASLVLPNGEFALSNATEWWLSQ